MGNMHLVTGHSRKEHITAADQGAFNAALIGTGQFVLDKGNVFKVQVISNNQIRVLDGELMMQGRFVRLEPDTYVDLTIDSGTQGTMRNDLIVARYTKDAVTGVEDCSLVVIKGTAVASNPADPAYTAADITNGAATLNDFPLWRIPISGINVGTPEALFGNPLGESLLTLPEIKQAVAAIHSEVDEKLAGITAYTKDETLLAETKTLYGLESDSVPDDVFRKIHNTQLEMENLALRAASRYSGFGSTAQATTASGGVSTGANNVGTVDIPIPEGAKLVFLSDIVVKYTAGGGGSLGTYPYFKSKGELVVNGVAYTVFEGAITNNTTPENTQKLVGEAKFNIVQLIGRPATSDDVVKFVVTTTVTTATQYNSVFTWNDATINARYL